MIEPHVGSGAGLEFASVRSSLLAHRCYLDVIVEFENDWSTVTRLLLVRGANVEYANAAGHTPSQVASTNGRSEVLAILFAETEETGD